MSENDVLDAVEAGASAVLLIVAALSDDELKSFIWRLRDRCGIDALVEIHDADEARRAIDAGARIIGINQRNLHTFDVDREHAASLISRASARLPDGVRVGSGERGRRGTRRRGRV